MKRYIEEMEEAKSDEAEYQEPVEAPKEEPMEPLETPQDTTTTPIPETVRTRKPKKAATPSVVIPEMNDQFFANLLRTQREAERATRLQRISEFNLL